MDSSLIKVDDYTDGKLWADLLDKHGIMEVKLIFIYASIKSILVAQDLMPMVCYISNRKSELGSPEIAFGGPVHAKHKSLDDVVRRYPIVVSQITTGALAEFFRTKPYRGMVEKPIAHTITLVPMMRYDFDPLRKYRARVTIPVIAYDLPALEKSPDEVARSIESNIKTFIKMDLIVNGIDHRVRYQNFKWMSYKDFKDTVLCLDPLTCELVDHAFAII